jgi:hypothetical protein
VQRALIVIGIVLIIVRLAWPWLGKLPLGRLPGDVLIDRGNFKLYFPITTLLLISALISVVLWLFRKG